jgi:hypothetical protein
MLKKIIASLIAGFALFLAISAAQAHGSSKSDEEQEVEAPDVEDDHEDNSGSGNSDDDDSPDESDDDDNSGSGSDSDDDDDHSGSGSSGSDDNSGSDERSDYDDKSENSGSSNSDASERISSSRSSVGAPSADDRQATAKSGNAEGRVARAEIFLEIAENERGERIRKGELVLLTSRANLGRKLASRGFRVIETFQMPALGMVGFRISVPPKANSEKMLLRLKAVDPKGVATFNHVYVPARGGATIANTTTATSSLPAAPAVNARIGLVDARVNANHPMLKSVKVSSRSFGIATSSDDEHGTAVASRIAEAAPGASLLVASVFSELNNGQECASVDAISKALQWLASTNVPVINLSLAGPPNPGLELITAKLVAKGHVLVAAVGNEGPHASPQYPAAYADVVGVTAVDAENRIYLYANQGEYVDFAARGVNARVAAKDGELETVSGTSFAAPVVAAALARKLKQPDPKLARKAELELAKSAQDAGEPGRDPVYGFGIITLRDQ